MPEQGTKTKRLVLIDGHGLAYRMFFAIQQELTTSRGEPTNATFGFTRTLVNLISEANPPDYLAVSFDVGRTFRDDLFADYKATRAKMPDSLQVQIDRIHDVLKAFNIPTLEVEGYEADDVLGTVARRASELGLHTLIVTGDKDLLQLVDEHTTVQLPGRDGGEVQLFDVAAVQEKYGLSPRQLVDLKALIGDKSDNIPGVAGIGEKTATRLLQQYGTLDNLYAHLDEITDRRARTALENGRESAYLSRKLAEIITTVPVQFDLESCRTRDYDRNKVVTLFRELEFRSLLKQIPHPSEETSSSQEGQQLSLFGDITAPSPEKPSVSTGEPPTRTCVVQDEEMLTALVNRLASAKMIAFDTETTSLDAMQARLVGISLAVEPGEGYYIPIGHQIGDGKQLPLERVIERLTPVMTDPDIPKAAHHTKFDVLVLRRHGLPVAPLSFDTMIAEWLIHPDSPRGKLGLKNLAFSRLGVEMTEIEELIGTGKKQITMDLVPIKQAAPYAAADADMTLRLVEPLQADLNRYGLEYLFHEIEMPLVPVLIDMEQAGVLVDTALLQRLSVEAGEILARLSNEIFQIVGYSFNLNSTQQLSDALFKKLQLPTTGLRRTSSGFYSTAADVLEELRPQDTTGVIEVLLQYREMEKLRSTYLDALPALVNPYTGRIHTSFNQTGVVTGRLSSSDPNLQNIPIRSETGRKVRDAFIAAPGCRLIGADYSQVELRILAHVSGDEALCEAFHQEQDVHAATAAAIFGIPLEQVSRAQRSLAKSINFGLMYGMGAFRLARDSGMTVPEAEAFIKAYFERFPKVRQYLDETRRMAIERGYVETLLKRRRNFEVFQNASGPRRTDLERRAAEREAVNMPIQGTAADIIKIAMIRLYRALHERGLHSKMILQVHDELVLEAPEEEVEEAAGLVKEVMEGAYPMAVPLRADVKTGLNWGELK
jgi:DNA polymerase-1